MSGGKYYSRTECFQALEIFEKFATAPNLKTTLEFYTELCTTTNLRPSVFSDFFPRIKELLIYPETQELLSRWEARANKKFYEQGSCSEGCKVLIIGAGPVGLRTAIEAQLTGCRCVVVEKREDFSRNNVLHLWRFIIADLRSLGAKKFYPKFCAGSIDHVAINVLQLMLLKIALLLGAEVHAGVEFVKLEEPCQTKGKKWTTVLKTATGVQHPLSEMEFDVVIGADGRRNSLPGFTRKVLRAKLAIAITANFVNHKTQAEARVEEISGVSFIFKQGFFLNLCERTGIDLENIVYYKNETHYFVMTAKKHSLLYKGVLLEDFADSDQLLHPSNVDTHALRDYVIEAVTYATKGKLPNLEFVTNHRGQPDVAIIDFTNMYAADYSCRVVERNGSGVLLALVGDSLLEPFWPTGSGCARGFLSALDTCWMIRSWAKKRYTSLDVIAERESVYRLLAQTTHENLSKDHANYTFDPHTRYPNLNIYSVHPDAVKEQLDSDNVELDRFNVEDVPESHQENQKSYSVDELLTWVTYHVDQCGLKIRGLHDIFIGGDALCAIIHRFRPDLIPEFPLPPDIQEDCSEEEAPAFRNQLAFDFMEEEYGVQKVVSGYDSVHNVSNFMEVLIEYVNKMKAIFQNEMPRGGAGCSNSGRGIPQMKPTAEPDAAQYFDLAQRSKTSHTTKGDSESNSVTRLAKMLEKRDRDGNSEERGRLSVPGMRKCKSSNELISPREKRMMEAEKNKMEAMQMLQMLKHQNKENQQKRAAETRSETIQAIRKVQMDDIQFHNKPDDFRTKDQDEFFDEYNLRMYRKKVPSIAERGQKIESEVLCPFKVSVHGASSSAQGSDNESDGCLEESEIKKFDSDKLRQIEHNLIHGSPGPSKSEFSKEKVPMWNEQSFLAKREKLCKQTDSSVKKGQFPDQSDSGNCIRKAIKKAEGKGNISIMNAQYFPGATASSSAQKCNTSDKKKPIDYSKSPEFMKKYFGKDITKEPQQLSKPIKPPQNQNKLAGKKKSKTFLDVPKVATSRPKSPSIEEQFSSVELSEDELKHLKNWTERNFNCNLDV